MKLVASAASAAMAVLGLASVQPASAAPTPALIFSTGSPTNSIATAARPDTSAFEIESADDFALRGPATVTSATFTGLIPLGSSLSNVQSVVVEIYRVFPADSNVSRTSGPNTNPPFSTPEVPTRLNSPSDVAFDSRDSSSGSLSFSITTLAGTFTALNSVEPGGIHPKPGQDTGGNGPVTGEEVEFDVSFTDPFSLPLDHYFFVPQVQLDNGDFFWLSAAKPLVPSPFPPGVSDLQSWTRDQFLDPDWLRVGTDIVGADHNAPAVGFNETFSLTGVVPEPGSFLMLGTALVGMGLVRRGRQRALHCAVEGTVTPPA